MKVTFIGHASILAQSNGLSILSDPWWRGPCFGAQWWPYPAPREELIANRKLDYVYISHGHHDHLHPGTLSTLDKSAKVLVSARLDLAAGIRALGFEVIEVPDDEPVWLGPGVSCRIMETHSGDTLMALTDGREVLLNLNDSLHSASADVQKRFVGRLRDLHPHIDYVFCGYGIASHFPNCYVIPGKDREATTARRQRWFNREWVDIIHQLNPKYGFPFAADVVFLEEDLFWTNEVSHNAERPTAAYRSMYSESPVVVIDIAPGFEIEDGKVVNSVLRQPVREATLRIDCAEQIVRANRHLAVDDDSLARLLGLVEVRVAACTNYLCSFDGDYEIFIRLHQSARGLILCKRGAELSVALHARHPQDDFALVYTTRLAYLRRAFTEAYGDEILFVGSGGIFEYRDRATASTQVHRELVDLLRNRQGPIRRRTHPLRRILSNAKRTIKRSFGTPAEPDLYNLIAWTVFRSEPSISEVTRAA